MDTTIEDIAESLLKSIDTDHKDWRRDVDGFHREQCGITTQVTLGGVLLVFRPNTGGKSIRLENPTTEQLFQKLDNKLPDKTPAWSPEKTLNRLNDCLKHES